MTLYLVEVESVIAGVFTTRERAEALRDEILARGYDEVFVFEMALDEEGEWE